MKPLLPFALLTAVSFTVLAGQLSPDSEALACGDYTLLMTRLTQADVDLAVSLLEKQVPERLTQIQTERAERRLFSRAAPRPETLSSVVVMSYQAPRVGDRVLAESKVVSGHVNLTTNGAPRDTVAYRIALAEKTVELLQGEEWVAAADWTRSLPRPSGADRTTGGR